MKIYLNSCDHNNSIYRSLCRLGISCTDNPDELGITSTIHKNESIDVTHLFNKKNLDPVLLSKSLGQASSYARLKNNLPPHDIKFKHILNEKLVELNLPRVDSIYPINIQQVKNFFNLYSEVFIKPISGQSGIVSKKFVENGGYKGIYYYPEYGYKIFNSYEHFISSVNIDDFIRDQNNLDLIGSKRCILQKAIKHPDHTFTVIGVVNGKKEYYFDPFVMYKPNGSELGYGSGNFNGLYNKDNTPNEEAIRHAAKDPSKANVDQYNILETIKTLFNATEVKNTMFYVQGIVIDNIAYLQDIGIRVPESYQSAHSDDILDSYLKFAYDIDPIVMNPLNKWGIYLYIKLRDGLEYTTEILDFARSINIIKVDKSGGQPIGIFHAYADTLDDLVNNINIFNKKYQ